MEVPHAADLHGGGGGGGGGFYGTSDHAAVGLALGVGGAGGEEGVVGAGVVGGGEGGERDLGFAVGALVVDEVCREGGDETCLL